MRKTLFWLTLATVPAWALPPAGHLGAIVLLYMVYGICATACLGWALLAAVVWRRKVRGAARALSRKPTPSLIMGVLALGWVLLSIGIAENAGGLFGALAMVMLLIFIGLLMAGLPGLLQKLGRGFLQLQGNEGSPPREIFWGAVLIFSAGAFPYLGWLLLLGAGVTSAGGALLSMFMPNEEEAPDIGPREGQATKHLIET